MAPRAVPPSEPVKASDDLPSVAPLVTVLITAYDRPDELRTTLRALRAQDYPALELLVIDDASPVALEPVVRDEWPEARFWRNPQNLGLIASRSLGMAHAAGAYILTLDDDSHPTDPDAITRAVARFEREPELGVIAFRVHAALEPPDPAEIAPAFAEQYTYAFIGCGEMKRAAAVREVGGYRDFFTYYKEEAEYALRLIDRGWRILYAPDLIVHHRMSPVGRSSARIAAYSFRNSIWTALLDLPAAAAAVDVLWKAAIGSIEMVRQGSARWLVWGIASTVRGLPRVLRERAPIAAESARLYNALRFRRITSAAALVEVRAPTWRERAVWFRTVWLRRRRPRAFWDRRSGVLGEGTWTTRARSDGR